MCKSKNYDLERIILGVALRHFIFTIAVVAFGVFTSGCKKSIIQKLILPEAEVDEPSTVPVASLDVATYTGGHSAINSSATSQLAMTFTNTTSTTLTVSAGTSSAPPAGLTVSTTGGVSCTLVAITAVSAASGTLEVSGCSGDGTVLVNVAAATLANAAGEGNAASTQRSVLVQNTLPTATVTVTNAVVGTVNAANTVVADFAARVANLSPTNANGEFAVTATLGSCVTLPTVSIAMSVVAGHSRATGTLSGGSCTTSSTLSIQLNLDQIEDLAGNVGVVGSNPGPETYDIDTTVPTADLAVASYSPGLDAINSSDMATLALTYNDAATTSLTAATGTILLPPAGLAVSRTGNVSCTSIEIVTPTSAGASIEVSGCSGDGTVLITVTAGTATSAGGLASTASLQRTVVVQNALPTATLAATDAVVGTTDGDNTITVTFASRVQDLSANNSGNEFDITGCATPPAVSTVMSVNGGGHSVATLTLSGGVCADGVTVTVALQRDMVTDIAGNVGLSTGDPTTSYDIDTTAPVATLAAASYPSSQGAIRTGQSATMALSFTNAVSQTLTASSGTSGAPPTGLSVVATGVTCTTVAIASPSVTGATISVSGCTGDGSLEIGVDAGVATSAGGLTNSASSTRLVWVFNTPPTTTTFAKVNATGGTDGSNDINVVFSSLVQAMDPGNLGGEVTVTGDCSPLPSVTIAQSDDGNGHSTATLSLSGGTCTTGDDVNVMLNLDAITDEAGNVGLAGQSPTETYQAQ